MRPARSLHIARAERVSSLLLDDPREDACRTPTSAPILSMIEKFPNARSVGCRNLGEVRAIESLAAAICRYRVPVKRRPPKRIDRQNRRAF
jgi:hypothetical protein